MTWTNLTFAFGSILTATKMTQLDDNFEAMANGDSGAPSITEAAMAADAVDRAVLKVSNATTVSGSLGGNAKLNVTLTYYAFFPMIHVQQASLFSSGSILVSGHTTDGGSATAPRYALVNTTAGTTYNYDLDYAYVTS